MHFMHHPGKSGRWYVSGAIDFVNNKARSIAAVGVQRAIARCAFNFVKWLVARPEFRQMRRHSFFLRGANQCPGRTVEAPSKILRHLTGSVTQTGKLLVRFSRMNTFVNGFSLVNNRYNVHLRASGTITVGFCSSANRSAGNRPNTVDQQALQRAVEGQPFVPDSYSFRSIPSVRVSSHHSQPVSAVTTPPAIRSCQASVSQCTPRNEERHAC